MERLTRLEKGNYVGDVYDKHMLEDNSGNGLISIQFNKEKIDKLVQKLGEYEELEENGLLLKLPCKEGTKVYEITDECNSLCCCNKMKCEKCGYYNLHIIPRILSLSQIVLHLKDFGETIFLDEELANLKLEEIKKKK